MSLVPFFEAENNKFTSFYFYNFFLKDVAKSYTLDRDNPVELILSIETGDNLIIDKYFIDPITLPLLVSLGEQLKKYHHNNPIKLHLINSPSTNQLLEFLDKADFFHLVGKNNNVYFVGGENIFQFDENQLGGNYKGNIQRPTHKIKGYSLKYDNLDEILVGIDNDEDKRDYLVQHYSYQVSLHFEPIFKENPYISSSNKYVEILAELITNGVLHSKSNVYALVFSNGFNTKLSISDNGIGFFESLSKKEDKDFYKKFELYKELYEILTIKVSDGIKKSLLSIFEALYFSMLKDRYGLFDLISNVVIETGGYFRIHNENSQIIISQRLINELIILTEIRNDIIINNSKLKYARITEVEYRNFICDASEKCKLALIKFAKQLFDKYSKDVQFSSIRFFEVKFRGVHIEVEIPNK